MSWRARSGADPYRTLARIATQLLDVTAADDRGDGQPLGPQVHAAVRHTVRTITAIVDAGNLDQVRIHTAELVRTVEQLPPGSVPPAADAMVRRAVTAARRAAGRPGRR